MLGKLFRSLFKVMSKTLETKQGILVIGNSFIKHIFSRIKSFLSLILDYTLEYSANVLLHSIYTAVVYSMVYLISSSSNYSRSLTWSFW